MPCCPFLTGHPVLGIRPICRSQTSFPGFIPLSTRQDLLVHTPGITSPQPHFHLTCFPMYLNQVFASGTHPQQRGPPWTCSVSKETLRVSSWQQQARSSWGVAQVGHTPSVVTFMFSCQKLRKQPWRKTCVTVTCATIPKQDGEGKPNKYWPMYLPTGHRWDI